MRVYEIAIVTLKMYGDESADGKKERVFTVAGVLGHEVEWQHGIRSWLRITGGMPFHATDVESARGKTAEQHERDLDLYRRLVQNLTESYLVGFAVSLDIQSHREIFPPHPDGTDAPSDWPYYKALSDLIRSTGRVAHRFNGAPEEPDDVRLEFTFDSRLESNAAAGQLYTALAKHPEWAEVLETKIVFEGGDEPRLEMADLLAREAMKELDRKVVSPSDPARTHFQTLDNCHVNGSKKFRFIETRREQWEDLRDFVMHPEHVAFAQDYFDWLVETRRVQHGKPAHNMMNWVQFNAYRDRLDRKKKREE